MHRRGSVFSTSCNWTPADQVRQLAVFTCSLSVGMKVVAILCLLAAAGVQVHAFPRGAPSTACPNIFPVGHNNPNNSVSDPTGGPFQLDISNFTMCTGAGSAPGYCYYPGETYYREFVTVWTLCVCLCTGRSALTMQQLSVILSE